MSSSGFSTTRETQMSVSNRNFNHVTDPVYRLIRSSEISSAEPVVNSPLDWFGADPDALANAPDQRSDEIELSVVIPCLNEADTLAECVEKAQRTINENRIAAEVIVADNGSTDGSLDIAASLGVKATVIMPEGAQLPKIEATRGYGADIILHGETVDDALDYAREYVAERGAVLIHPFDHPDIVAGQGTCGLEILEQVPDVKTMTAASSSDPVAVAAGVAGAGDGVSTRIRSVSM